MAKLPACVKSLWQKLSMAGALLMVSVAVSVAADPLGLDEPIRPLVAPTGLDAQKVLLGRRLFSDPILSADGTVSCASCHDLAAAGADHRPRSTGIHGAVGAVRAPTVYNSGLNFRQFWDGRAATLEAQVDGPVTNPLEMGAAWPAVLARLDSHADYRRAFEAVFGAPPTAEAVESAIASFERSLVTVGSRFDRWLLGDATALTDLELEGYRLFKSYGCASCHQGANVGGNMFQKFGFMGNYFRDRGQIAEPDLGRYNITHREDDRFVFKVPSLRLAAAGGPYFHDGSVSDLAAVIRIMGRYQLGRDIPDGDQAAIIAFLGSLVGEHGEVRR
ncbi:MAG: cytochrome c peroxidase [Rhodospirillaceae bacterium]